MYQNYRIDVGDDSIWLIARPEEIHRQMLFQISEVGKFIAQEGYYIQGSGRQDYMLLFTTQGEGLLTYRGKTMKLHKDSVALLDCNEYHEFRTAGGNGAQWEFYWMHFDGHSLKVYFDTLFRDRYMVLNAGQDTGAELLTSQFESIIDTFEKPGLEVFFRLSDSVSRILTCLLDIRNTQRENMEKHKDAIQASVEFIKENYRQPLTVEQIAGRTKLSKYYFIKLFKEYMRVTPYEFLVIHRVTEAKKLLRSTDFKVAQISKKVGFGDECNFNRTFKKVTGLTPLQFKGNS